MKLIKNFKSMQKKSGTFTHINETGDPSMVNISNKKITKRTAVAQSIVKVPSEVVKYFNGNEIETKKGPVFHTAKIAGVMAAKNTGDLIPLCHPLALEDCQIDIFLNERQEIIISCKVTIEAKTGVEMEALTGASVAALTIYDMCKALSHDIIIKETRLMEKKGGKSDFKKA